MSRRVDDDRIAEMTLDGMTTAQIMAEVGCCRSTVGVARRRSGVGAQPVDVTRVVELTRAGWSTAAIAVELDCSTRTVNRARRRGGVGKPPARRLTPSEVQQASAMLDDGASITEVERTFGTSIGGLHGRFRGRGLTLKEASALGVAARQLRRRAREDGIDLRGTELMA